MSNHKLRASSQDALHTAIMHVHDLGSHGIFLHGVKCVVTTRGFPTNGGLTLRISTRRPYHMRGPSCRAICVIGQTVPLVDRAGSLILMVMATQRKVNLRTDPGLVPVG